MTKLNGKSFHINAIYIETVESHPDTIITLTNGKKFIVAETEEEIIQSMIQFYRAINILGLNNDKGGALDEE
ncbi:flagellar protein FlbD [Peribacillus deserti]|uniref:Flagellar protein FlbD n=1 Tax=Peribacillus deserti TaxID=673318 RepID=A0ABS2QIA8_9BACI|nr:flagellar protein FlbD [Peribacillus deserti]